MMSGFEAELNRILRAARRYWWLPLVLALIFAPAAWFAGNSVSSSYVARSQLLVTPSASGSGSLANDSQRPETYRQLVKSGPVLDAVILELDLDLTRQELASKIETVIVPGTTIFEIQVRDADPDLAAEINNAVARQVESKVADLTMGQMQRNLDEFNAQLATQRDQLTVIETRLAEIDTPENAENSEVQAEIGDLRQQRIQLQQTIADLESSARSLRSEIAKNVVPIAIVDTAHPPANPEGATPMILGALGAVIGLGAGVLIGLWREYANPTVQDSAQLRSITGAAPIASISASDLGSDDSPNLALVKARIRAIQASQDGKLAVVSPQPISGLRGFVASDTTQKSTGSELVLTDGLLSNVQAVEHIDPATSASILVVEYGITRIDEVQQSLAFLADVQAPVVGTVAID